MISKESMSVYNKPTNSNPPKMCLLIRTKKKKSSQYINPVTQSNHIQFKLFKHLQKIQNKKE